MPWTGTGVSITRNHKLQSVRPGSQDLDGTDPYRDGRFEFKDSAGKFFKVVATQYTGDKAQLRVR
tara:strand:- start:182 stop:376 length:195 start_codon:yes stop_codon:yes gene_type:complete